MKISELAKMLRISNNAIETWIRSGKLKATMTKPLKGVGGHEYWNIEWKDWEDYLKKLN